MMNGVVVFLMVVVVANAQTSFQGRCPDVQTKRNFNLKKFSGKWFEAERYFGGIEKGGKCVTAEYNLRRNGRATLRYKLIDSIYSPSIEAFGKVSKNDPAKLSFHFPSIDVDSPYWILATDYKNYAVVWSCAEFESYDYSIRGAWILTRSKNPTSRIIQKAYSALDKNGISKIYFVQTNQTNCPLN
ncbi:unnamed protein product [Brassicogethes aeneus]|uniref:Apolipoprotein D n=1 Tax=Brassicogethes aeneus TaxID=1431903 RepID=A0A9P0AXX7_BRAAE|nr:unnamed protein product [Brassicogethes aeneus]